MPIFLDSPEQPIACPPSQQGHSRFWCYSDRHSAYGLMPPVLITVSDLLIFLSVMACHSLMRTQANPLCLSENLISQHACRDIQIQRETNKDTQTDGHTDKETARKEQQIDDIEQPQGQHCPTIMMPPQLTNGGMFTSTSARFSSQSRYSMSNFYRRI